MGKLLLKVGAVLVIAVLGFNYFFGSPEEKESSRQVFAQVRELSASVAGLMKSEKEKFDEGKYHEALAKLKAAIGIEREQAKSLGENGKECLASCQHLQQQEEYLEEKLQTVSEDVTLSDSDRNVAAQAIRDEILKLASDTELLAGRLRM